MLEDLRPKKRPRCAKRGEGSEQNDGGRRPQAGLGIDGIPSGGPSDCMEVSTHHQQGSSGTEDTVCFLASLHPKLADTLSAAMLEAPDIDEPPAGAAAAAESVSALDDVAAATADFAAVSVTAPPPTPPADGAAAAEVAAAGQNCSVSPSADTDAVCQSCSVSSRKAIWRCAMCNSRACCFCVECECAARGDQQRCVGNESTPGSSATVKQFNCNLCRIKHGAPCTIKFKDTGTCSRCREGCNDEYLRCKICGQCECAACSAATSIELDQSAKTRKAKGGQGNGRYTCLACCCAPQGTVAVAEGTQAAHGLGNEMDRVINGRNIFAGARRRALATLWAKMTGKTLQDSRTGAMPVRGKLRQIKKDAESFCRATACLMKAGFEEVAKEASCAVSRLNTASRNEGLNMPSTPLDLVYLMDDKYITWELVQQAAAASQAHEAIPASLRKAITSASQVLSKHDAAGASDGTSEDRHLEETDRIYRVGFWSHDLFRRSATLDLARETILGLVKDEKKFRVLVYSIETPEDVDDPSSYKFVKFLRRKHRYRGFAPGAEPQSISTKMKSDFLDVLIHMPGFNNGHLYKVLADKPATAVVQWLGCAGPTCAVKELIALVHYTISTHGL